MIDKSFIFLDKIGSKTEQEIWAQGIKSWDDFIETSSVMGISDSRKTLYNLAIQKARANLRVANHPFFYEQFPQCEHWRLYDEFKDHALYIDIETSGYYGDMTVLGIYDGRETYMMIKGHNMQKGLLLGLLKEAKCIVTFNGASFDIPIIEKYFNIKIDLPHIDLRHVCAKIGLTGGLKKIEQQLGIKRDDEVVGVSGADAIYLWNMYRSTGDQRFLEKLIKYNEEDIVNLKPLAEYAIPKLWAQKQLNLG